jgi:UDP-N-acetylglucosamine:LPS N-acetylglucosamine transferase
MICVDLIYFNAGGGHRAAALALQQAMQGGHWQVRLINLVEILDPKGVFFKTLGLQPEDFYNKMLASGMTLGMSQELKLLQKAIRLSHKAMVRKMHAHWLASQPDMVVSVIPNFNRALCESLKLARPQTPYVTVITDMADYPPNFWIEPDQAQHVVCGTAHAVQQALQAGCAPERVHRSSGMILSPRFYDVAPIDRVAERRKHGFDAHRAVGLVMFGGYGAGVMKRIAASLSDTPLILICGRNAVLAEALRAMPSRAVHVVVEFTNEMAYWMQLADFFIGKPGPASLSEAVHMGLPVIITRNVWTMPQERWNTEWVRSHGLGVVHRSFRSVHLAVQDIVSQLPTWQSKVRQVRNRAIFEVPQLLAHIANRTHDVTNAAPKMPEPG